jgi:predicted ATPase/DNA-binding NarL/FixJ family response regulator
MVDVPSPGTPLLGRDDEVTNVAALLHASDVRLVTITGPGGVGKTRLALEVAGRVGAELADGAVFIDLAGVTEPDTVPLAIAGTLDVGQSGTDDLSDALRQALARRELLVVLDNFEQVLAAAHVPVRLVERCPGLRVLVTSRAPLRVRPERVFRLAALPVPIRSSDADVASVGQFASVELFCARAGAIRPEFRLGDDNVAAIAGICRVVDGLPLAIELAAARITHLQPAVLLERLESPASRAPLDTLGRGANDLPARQRTMRDTIAWSYNLLNPHEQRLLRRLSIFDGDCSLDAIESICADPTPLVGDDVALVGAALLDALAVLVDLHLVEPDDHVRDEARFGMLVTIREFGREQLDGDEQQALRSQHAQYYATLVDEAAVGLESSEARTWARRLEHELVEIRAVLRHLLATDNIVDGLRVVTGAGEFWMHGGHVVEGRQWLVDLLDRVPEASLPARARAAARIWTAQLGMDQNVAGDRNVSSATLAGLEEALAVARSVHDQRLELRALCCLSHILIAHEVTERAVSFAEEGIARCAQLGERWWLAELLVHAAVLAQWSADRERAAALALDACAVADEVGNDRLAIASRMQLAFAAPGTTLGHLAPALLDVVPRAEDLGDRRTLAWLYTAVGWEALDAARMADAARWLGAGLDVARDLGFRHAAGLGMLGAQTVASLAGEWSTAARVYGAASSQGPMLRRSIPPKHRDLWRQSVVAARNAMGDDAFETAARDGAKLSWDEALNEAMTICRGQIDTISGPQQTRSRPHGSYELELTDRERDVLRLIAAGGTNKDVAAALGIRAKTVMHHSVAIYRKLGVRGRAEATAYAYRNNLIDAAHPA